MNAPGSNTTFLILETGQPAQQLRRHGGFGHWIRVAAGLPRDAAVIIDVEAGDPLPARAGFAGVLISGSAAMVTQRLDWSERSAAWLRDAVEAGLPVFGICYGHQLLAHALGGEVGDNPAGREMGTTRIELLAAAQDDPLFGGLPDRFPAQVTHLQTVLRPPANATVLAKSARDDCQAFRCGSSWGVQFHPEFSTTHMRGYIAARRDALSTGGFDVDALLREVGAAPLAREVLRRFVRHARKLGNGS